MSNKDTSPSEISSTRTTQKSGGTSVGVNVTTKTEVTPIGEGLELNPEHFKTVPGILKLLQLLVAIICMGCGAPAITDYARFFMFVVALFFIVTLLLCFIYFFCLKKLLSKLPWLLMELVATGSGAVLYLLASIIMLSISSRRDYYYALSYHGFYSPYIAAGVFGLFNTLLYGAGAFFLFMEWKNSKATTTTSGVNGNA